MATVGPAAAHRVHGVWVHVPLTFAELRRVPRVRTGRRLIAPAGSEHWSVVTMVTRLGNIRLGPRCDAAQAKGAICAGSNASAVELLLPENYVTKSDLCEHFQRKVPVSIYLIDLHYPGAL